MSTLNNTVVNGVVTQTQAATAPNHLVRLAEAQALLAALFQGAWNTTAIFTAGMMVTDNGSLYIANQTTLNQQPSANPTVWRLAAAAGMNGASAYPYTAYASDIGGTGFSLTPSPGLGYVAFLLSPTVIASPAASDFAGRWTKYVGAAGDPGTNGNDGNAGASVYGYIGYASDTSGSGFSLTPGSGLNYIAFLMSPTVIASPNASNFAGLWKNYATTFTVTAPITLSGGVLAVNAASANTVSYLVQRDSNGDFAARTVSVTSLVVGGSATLAFAASNLTVNTAMTVAGAMTLTGLTGVLKAATGVVAGSADTNDLTEGAVNLVTPTGNAYFTRARVLATPLTGYSTAASAPVLLATDTLLAALGKIDAALVNGGNFAPLAGATFTGGVVIAPSIATAGSPNMLLLTGAAHTTLAGGTEAADAFLNLARTVQFNTGALTAQRAVRIDAPTYAFVGASTLTTSATVAISGPPVAGTNATVTTAVALKISAGAVGSGTTSAYGLYVDAPTGATNNYAAAFNTGDVLVNAGWLRVATSYGLKVNSVQVVTGRQTGWTAATGTATRTSFATGSVTLPNLAQAVKALIDDLITHGLIGT